MPTPILSARRSRLATVGVATLAAVAIAACGGDDGESTVAATTGATGPTGATGATGPTGASGQAQEVTVSETDFELEPAEPTVSAGEVAITATNESESTVHSLAVEGPAGAEELSKELGPGDSGDLAVALEDPGRYRWFCPIANHEQLGMVGEIVVEG